MAFANLWNLMRQQNGGGMPQAGPMYGSLSGGGDKYGSAISNILMSIRNGGSQFNNTVRPLLSNTPEGTGGSVATTAMRGVNPVVQRIKDAFMRAKTRQPDTYASYRGAGGGH